MPVHDWTRVEAGIFHDFHHAWIEDIKRALNSGILPDEYYALAEQFAGGFGPDVLTLEGPPGNSSEDANVEVSSRTRLDRQGTSFDAAVPCARRVRKRSAVGHLRNGVCRGPTPLAGNIGAIAALRTSDRLVETRVQRTRDSP